MQLETDRNPRDARPLPALSESDIISANANQNAQAVDEAAAGTQLVDLAKSADKRFKAKLTEAQMEGRPIAEDVLAPSLYVAAFAAVIAALSNLEIVPAELPLICTFLAGYACIVFEEAVAVEKSAVALLLGISCWSLVPHAAGLELPEVLEELGKALSSASQIVFFLMGAMAIVETVDAHKGFEFVTDRIRTTDRRLLVAIIGLFSFFLSAVLDNLTTTIVVVSLLSTLVPKEESETRRLLGGLAVVAANAGGAWSPVGDVTTTMLWMGGEVTARPLIASVFLPSFLCVCGAMGWQAATMPGPNTFQAPPREKGKIPRGSELVTAVGLGGLVFVPVFKQLTGLPPFAGMLVSTAALWALTDRLHGKDSPKLRMTEALRRIDTAGSLFFLGILLAVSALETAGLLTKLADVLNNLIPNETLVAGTIGAVSAVIDNVPLVAAAMGMYDLGAKPPDAPFWDLIAFCAGTGGSMLIIGSAAGIAFMGMEEVTFGWYLRRIAPGAVLGYLLGIAALVLEAPPQL